MCGVHFCFKYFIQILYFCGEKVKCGSSTSPELEAGQLWCVSPADTLTCTTLHKPDMQGGKKDVSTINRDTCLIADGQDLADFADNLSPQL